MELDFKEAARRTEGNLIIDFFLNGFYAALAKFRAEFLQQQEIRDVALAEKLTQILEGQQASTEAIAAIGEAVTSETAQVNEALAKLADATVLQAQTIEEQKQQIKDLLARVEAGETELAEAEDVIDQIIQKQQEQLSAQQQAAAKVAAIFNPPVPEEQLTPEQA